MLKIILSFILKMLFRVEVRGLENFEKAGKRVLMVVNHQSFLDALLLGVFLPQKPLFAINTYIANRWYFKPLLACVETHSIDPTNPMALRSIITQIRQDKKCVIFPEGRITVTGSLMKIYKGSAMIADKSGAMILPIRIEGAQYSLFSHLKGKVRRRLFPKITLTLLPPVEFSLPTHVKGRQRSQAAGKKLEDIMTQLIFTTSDCKKTLFQSLIEQVRLHGRSHKVLEDIQRTPLQYGQFLTRCFALASQLRRHGLQNQSSQKLEHVGVLLPNTVANLCTFFALHICGNVPAMLNFSAGTHALLCACKAAQIRRIYTSKKFISMAKLEQAIQALKQESIQIYYLEDIAAKLTPLAKIQALVASYFPQFFYEKSTSEIYFSPAVILFTSGSEGVPKGVVLSHENIQANRFQVAASIDCQVQDVIFNALPMFHSFGLTAGTLLPLLSGMRVFLYPSPLHYKTVPELVYDSNATMIFGTDTFLAAYAKFAHPYDFYSLRYAFAGAEKLKDATRTLWAEKFGVRIFEGYGATETAPVLSLNTPMHHKVHTVGKFLPGIKHELHKVEGIKKGGRLVVQGPNIMQGYLFVETPGVLVSVQNNTYDTGDIVEIDAEGYISIVGRAKRFAKIAGEMISLTAVETYISHLWPGYNHAVIHIPDEKKGEALILVTDYAKAQRKELMEYAIQHGFSDLSVPKIIRIAEKIPLLGTGKIDYVTLYQQTV